jgi:hypothetical protein
LTIFEGRQRSNPPKRNASKLTQRQIYGKWTESAAFWKDDQPLLSFLTGCPSEDMNYKLFTAIMEQHIFFAFSLIIEGTTEKVLQLIMPLKSIYKQNLGFIEQKMFFLNTTERLKQ